MLVNIPYLFFLMALHLISAQNLNESSLEEFKDLEREIQAGRHAVLASTDIKLVLLCRNGLMPQNNGINLDWKKISLSDGKMSLVSIDGQRTKQREDFALIIEHPHISDSGLYMCGNYTQYLVDVVKSEPTEKLTQEELDIKGANSDKLNDMDNYLKFVMKEGIAQPNDMYLAFYNETVDVIAYNSWGNWSPCDRCNSEGRSRRIGICTVAYWRHLFRNWISKAILQVKDRAKEELYRGAAKIAVENGQKNTWGLTKEQIYDRNRKLNQTIEEYLANSEEKVSNEALKEAFSEFNITIPILNKILTPHTDNEAVKSYLDQFPTGIPCRSYHLEARYKNLGDIASRKSIIVYAPCEEKCLNKPGINEKFLGGTESVKKEVIEITEGTPALIKCPGNDDGQYIVWSFQDAEMNVTNVEKNSGGRISVDWNSNLLISKVFSSDFGIYRCWKRFTLIGIVQLREPHSLDEKVHFPIVTLNNVERKEAILASTDRKLILLCHNGSGSKSAENNKVWNRTLSDDNKEFLVHIDGERITLRDDLALIIEEPSISDSGIYRCETSIYLVDVVDHEPTETLMQEEYENRRSIFNPSRKLKNYLKFLEKQGIIEQKYLRSAFYDETEDILVFNYWRDWSHCDKCDKKGKARTIGICTIARLNLVIKEWLTKAVSKVMDKAKQELYTGSAKIAVEYGQKNTQDLTIEQIYKRNLKLNQSIEQYLSNNANEVANEALKESLLEFNITLTTINSLYNNLKNEEALSFLDLFPSGIPCRSHHLEERYKYNIYVKQRKSVILYAQCEEKCSNEKETFYIRKTPGSKKPGFNENLPRIPKLVGRDVLFVNEGASAIIKCPGNEDGQYLVWHFEKEELNMANIEKITEGRVAVDWNNNLKISKLIGNDSGVYSCWNRSTLIGTVKLRVSQSSVWTEKSASFNFMGVGLSYGVILTFSVIVIISFWALKNRNLKTKV